MENKKRKIILIISIIILCIVMGILSLALFKPSNDKNTNSNSDNLSNSSSNVGNDDQSNNLSDTENDDQSNNLSDDDSFDDNFNEKFIANYPNIAWADKNTNLSIDYFIEDGILKRCVKSKFEKNKRTCEESILIKMEEKPIKITANRSCSGSDAYVLTNKNNLYLIKKDTLVPVLTNYKFINMTKMMADLRWSEYSSCSVMVSYFLTDSGELIDISGAKYEEINPNYIIGEIFNNLYYGKNNEIYYKDYELEQFEKDCDSFSNYCHLVSKNGEYKYSQLKNDNGKVINAKYIFIRDDNEFVIINNENEFYLFNNDFLMIESNYNEKVIKKVDYESSNECGKNVLITFNDETTFNFYSTIGYVENNFEKLEFSCYGV